MVVILLQVGLLFRWQEMRSQRQICDSLLLDKGLLKNKRTLRLLLFKGRIY